MQKGLGKISQPLNLLAPIVDEFLNFLTSDEADIIGYQIKDFSVLVEE